MAQEYTEPPEIPEYTDEDLLEYKTFRSFLKHTDGWNTDEIQKTIRRFCSVRLMNELDKNISKNSSKENTGGRESLKRWLETDEDFKIDILYARRQLGIEDVEHMQCSYKDFDEALEDVDFDGICKILYTVRYADYHCQQKVGQGRSKSSNSSAINTGTLDNLLMKDGYVTNDGTGGVILDGRENPWGNIFKWLDGGNIQSRQLWICKDPKQYVDDKFASPYEKVSYTNCSSDGYISELGFDTKNPQIRFPTKASGSDSTYIPDYYYQSSGSFVVCVGGSWSDGGYCGLWYLSCDSSSSSSDSYIGARLLYRPVK